MAFTIKINGTTHRVEVDVTEETRSALGSSSKKSSSIGPAHAELVYSKCGDNTDHFRACHRASLTGMN